MLRNANHTLIFSRFDTGFSPSFVHKSFPLICFENSFKRMNNLLGKHPLLSITGISSLLKDSEVQKIDLEKNSHLFLAYIIYNHQYGMCIVYVYVHRFSFSRTKAYNTTFWFQGMHFNLRPLNYLVRKKTYGFSLDVDTW